MERVACVEIAAFLADDTSAEARAACAEVARSLEETGIVILRDPRVSEVRRPTRRPPRPCLLLRPAPSPAPPAPQAASSSFLDLLEDYFAQDEAAKRADERPELHYQVGTTPEGVEVPISSWSEACIGQMAAMPAEHRPSRVNGADPKWRFFWRIGERPPDVYFEDLNAAPVLPSAFPQWRETMDGWGESMLRVRGGGAGGGARVGGAAPGERSTREVAAGVCALQD